MLLVNSVLSVLLAVHTPQTQAENAPHTAQVPDTARLHVTTPKASKSEDSKPVTDKKHPDFVRCKSESVIGSRAKRKRTCMTNRQWVLVERRQNEASKTFAGDNFAAGHN